MLKSTNYDDILISVLGREKEIQENLVRAFNIDVEKIISVSLKMESELIDELI